MATMNQATAIERPTPQMESQIARLDSALEQLEREVNALIGGLTTVLRSEPPQPAQTNPKLGEVLVPLASHLHGVSERMYALIAGVSGARDRLEL